MWSFVGASKSHFKSLRFFSSFNLELLADLFGGRIMDVVASSGPDFLDVLIDFLLSAFFFVSETDFEVLTEDCVAFSDSSLFSGVVAGAFEEGCGGAPLPTRTALDGEEVFFSMDEGCELTTLSRAFSK
ncbi:unnamed protein product [Schistosoma curassoni]|uniref:Secreted protein n=1 Tax=Schistosoma curassoni TaxID=6186 RepID=A0A183KAU7_9TREM|nr:unnamed protein product [Schistosoma curassoni]